MIDSDVVVKGKIVENNSTKSIGLIQAISFTITIIVGSGIFISVSPTYNVFDSNSVFFVILFWTIGGVISTIGGLCYAELGSRVPESGGDRAYYNTALNQKFARTFVIVYIFIVKSITYAALSITSALYILSIFVDVKEYYWSHRSLAFGILLLCFIINCISKSFINAMGIVFTVLKMAIIFVIIGCGIYYLSIGNVSDWNKPFDVSGFDMLKFSICFINIFWSFEGWNCLGMVAGDMKNPQRDLPLSIAIGVVSVVFLYVLVNVSYVAVLGYNEVRANEAVATNLAKKVFGKFYQFVPALISLSAAGALNSNLYSGAAVSASAGFSGDLPKIFSLVHRKRRTPIFSLLILLITSTIFVPFEFQVLLNYCAFISWFFYFLSFLCLLKMKYSRVYQKGSNIFELPIVFILPLFVICSFIVGTSFYQTPVGCSIFATILVLIFFLQFLPKRFSQISILKTANYYVSIFFIRWVNLETANSNDIS